MSDALTEVIAYHQATKHHLHAYARGPDQMDWATQPDPFRRYEGAPLIALDPDQFPFTMLPWTPRIHLALFVHRVQDLDTLVFICWSAIPGRPQRCARP